MSRTENKLDQWKVTELMRVSIKKKNNKYNSTYCRLL